MMRLFNTSTCAEDLERYTDADDLRAYIANMRLDGLEVLPIGENSLKGIPKELVAGVHLSYFNSWLDMYRGDFRRATAEYGSPSEAEKILGGPAGEMAARLRAQLDWCDAIGAKYVVYHVGNVTLDETMTYSFEHSDADVISSALEIINSALSGRQYRLWFLVENLWWPGFTFTRPEITRALLEGIDYKKKGIMLDTGHLMHTDTSIDSPAQGVDYINRRLDEHGELCAYIKGVHLHSGASGAFVRKMLANPPVLTGDYFTKLCAAYENVLKIDPHVPLECDGARQLIARIAPEYVTYEFITRSRAEHAAFVKAQNAALGIN